MRTTLNEINAITLFVEDLAATKQFYQDVFGHPILLEDDNSVLFQFGNTMVNLLVTPAAHDLINPGIVGPPHGGARVQFSIFVDDVDRECAELERRGVPLLNGPIDRAWGMRTATFVDPGGHIWELAQNLRAGDAS